MSGVGAGTPICLNVGDDNVIDSDQCLCINAWENLLTGGAWYAVNGTEAQVSAPGSIFPTQASPESPSNAETNNQPYGTKVESTIGCAPFTYPEPPKNIEILSKSDAEIELQWSIDSYDKGGRFIPVPYVDPEIKYPPPYVPAKHISTLLTTVQYSSTSPTSGFVDVAAIDPLPYWCAFAELDQNGVLAPKKGHPVSHCRKCATTSDCLPDQICNVGKITVS